MNWHYYHGYATNGWLWLCSSIFSVLSFSPSLMMSLLCLCKRRQLAKHTISSYCEVGFILECIKMSRSIFFVIVQVNLFLCWAFLQVWRWAFFALANEDSHVAIGEAYVLYSLPSCFHSRVFTSIKCFSSRCHLYTRLNPFNFWLPFIVICIIMS